MLLSKGDTVGLISCSNGLKDTEATHALISALTQFLEREYGLSVVSSASVLVDAVTGTTQPPTFRAGCLMELYRNDKVKAIFDLSGGDLANEILPFLDFDSIKAQPKPYFGYSDNTVITNALQRRTGMRNYLYNPKVLVSSGALFQKAAFDEMLSSERVDMASYLELAGPTGCEPPIDSCYLGGNLRCLLKLAGTAYWPDFQNTIIVLESAGGQYEQMRSGLAQLDQLGVFSKVHGVILGQFTALSKNKQREAFILDCKKVADIYAVPLWTTAFIGHNDLSKPIPIG